MPSYFRVRTSIDVQLEISVQTVLKDTVACGQSLGISPA